MFLNWNGKSRMFKSIFCFLALSFSLLGFSAERMADPLHEAVSRLNLVEVERLLATPGYSVNAVDYYGNTPLLYAAMESEDANNLIIIKLLLDAGANIDARDPKNGNTALHFAVINRSPSIVEILLSYGANYGALNNEDLMPEQVASINPPFAAIDLNAECISKIVNHRNELSQRRGKRTKPAIRHDIFPSVNEGDSW